MRNIELNDIQRELATQNHNLIYDYMYKHKLYFDDTVDWYGLLAENLCKAAYYFEDSRNVKFSTLVFKFFDNAVTNQLKKIKDKQYYISLSDFIDGTEIPIIESVIDNNDCFSESETKECIKKAYDSLSERQKTVVKLILQEGLKQQEVAERLNIARTCATRDLKIFRTRLRELLEGNENDKHK